MSLIVKFQDQIFLMTKGADSIVLPRIRFLNDAHIKVEITKSLLNFAKEGLRTLVVG